MTRIEVSRAVLVEPSSVALVLAGPAARELWPRRSDRLVGLVGSQSPHFAVAVDPPTRTGVGFAANVRVRAGDDVVATGRLSIAPADGEGCRLQLALVCDDEMTPRLHRDATRYLSNVATTTRDRASAA